ncbi:hypothetical protein, partial [Vibrio sp.]|uniref:hypothetical protein n=1 Tax=Vibrio sp. TaxID=678 RepID=UPI003D12C63D
VADIDALLCLRHPKTKRKIWSSVHFFGMSEATSKMKLFPRLKVAELHQMTVFADCCRTTAKFGKGRRGSALEKQLAYDHIKQQVFKSQKFQTHTYRQEFVVADTALFVTQEFYDLIDADIETFWMTYNELMRDDPHYQMPHHFDESEFDEAREMAWQLTSIRAVDHLVFERLKAANWTRFKSLIEYSELTSKEARFEAIKVLFSNKAKAEPVQLPLPLVA